ncbi:CoA-binding protein [Rurimicrobium arvi]|uniref:CoA-binding protein n=1 Tax=Rurimicrobium arvi TaxID=2049916 RepID=A0ABP8MRA5_9BACT
MNTIKKTLVLGASENPDRYSNMAIRRLRAHQHEVLAIGNKEGKVLDVAIQKETEPFEHIDTVTLYLNPRNQQAYYDYIIKLHPKRIIFNPGTENPDLEARANAAGIETMEACTLVLLSTGQY